MDHNNLYYREYKPLLKKAGLEDEGLTFHSLRHTFATALSKRGEHPKNVSEMLGHSSVSITLDTFSHVILAPIAIRTGTLGVEDGQHTRGSGRWARLRAHSEQTG